jgi:glutamate 5-kinase
MSLQIAEQARRLNEQMMKNRRPLAPRKPPTDNCTMTIPAPSVRARDPLRSVTTIVIKLGSQLLSGIDGRLDCDLMSSIAGQIAALRQRRLHVTMVSSGAIAAGVAELKLPRRPTDLAILQAVAAVGQRRLMDAWASAFAPLKMPVAQLLLTREDVDDRARYLNVRNTITAAHELGAVPIINENDTISTAELARITFGDNDILAAHVAHALRADLLVLLSVVDGILDGDGRPVRTVAKVDDVRELVRAQKSAAGKGGFTSKLEAARMIAGSGEMLIVADGRMPDLLPRLLDGEEIGTLFCPMRKKRSARSRWIGSVRPAGAMIVDAGAARALADKNKSLLPAGIVAVRGAFSRGDVVAIETETGEAIARGLTNYSAADVERIRGRRTQEVRTILAEEAFDEVVHRDHLVLEGD